MNSSPLTILLVEDNPADVYLIREYLKNTGLHIGALLEAHSIASARALLVENKIDVILMDLSLPDSKGFSTMRVIHDIAVHYPIIILSGLDDEETALDAVKDGTQDYLVKGDFNEKLLAKSIQYAVERKRNIDQVVYSEERYKLLFEKNPVPMWAYNVHTLCVITVNAAALEYYGYAREEFLTLTIKDVQAPGGRRKFMEEMEALKSNAGIKTLREQKHIRKNGSVADVDMVLHDVVMDGVEAKLVVVYDITEQKKAETHLRLLESVITNTTDAVMITEAYPIEEPGPRIIYVNEAFSKMTGFSAQETLGRSPRFLQGPKTDRTVLNKINKALHQGQGIEVELINYKKNGEEYWIDFSVMPIANEEGQFTHFISIQRDTTVRREQENLIRKTLEKKVEERTRELNTALLQQKELVEMKNRFISMASHEFKTPLASINFAAGYIKKYRNRLTADDINAKLENIEKQVRHMNFLLDDVLTMGKSEVGKIEVLADEINIRTFLNRIIEEVRHSTNFTHQIELVCNLSKNVLHTDEKLLRNIFINLMTNAIKFSPGKESILVSVSETGSEITFEVRDKGMGIESQELKEIFQPFQRGKNVAAIPGTGLGLSIVKRAVDLLKGSINVYSNLGEGSTFVVKLQTK